MVLTVFSMSILGHRFAIVVTPSLHLAITCFFFFLRSLRVYPSLRSSFLFDSCFSIWNSHYKKDLALYSARVTATTTFSPHGELRVVLSFPRTRKIRRAIDAVCTLRSTARKLRCGLLLAVRELTPLLYDRERGSCILCT